MSARKAVTALLCLAALTIPAVARADSGKPAWLLNATALPTNFPAGANGSFFGGPDFLLVATNVGGAPATGPIAISATLPTELSATNVPADCKTVGQVVSCMLPGPVAPGRNLNVTITVNVSPTASGSPETSAKVESPGAAAATASTATPISSAPASYGLLPDFRVPLSEADGSPATLAGFQPYQLTATMGFPTEKSSVGLGGAGHLHNVNVDFPPGETINPAATAKLCTEQQLTNEFESTCPIASQIGTVDIVTITGGPLTKSAPLYNMVPPPGTAASVGFDALGAGIFVHLNGEVRSDGDYGITGGTADALALTNNPVFGALVQLWGDPSAESHDEARGYCLQTPEADSCPIEGEKSETALLALPGHCTKQPDLTFGHTDSWEHPGVISEARYESASLSEAPIQLSGCNQLAFNPTIEAKPTTSLIDSPSGLDFHLHQPQETRLGGRSSASLKDATVVLPESLVVNPSSAVGQQACSPTQAGLLTPVGDAQARFSKDPPSCPNASKVGTLEVTTPLLAQLDLSANKVLRDPVTHQPLPRPVPGSVYLAEPFKNPFGSLLAVYLSVEDPASGTYARLAARVSTDSVTGQITAKVTGSPQLPVEDVHVHLFEGANASLRTPPACGGYETKGDFVPWSSPETPNVSTTDSFATTAAPAEGPCPTSAAAASNKPSFVAGTLVPQAGAYSPLVMKLAREDASQPIGGFETTLPPGLSARLASVPYCPEVGVVQAVARSNPNEGVLEQANPSCPTTSQLGTVDVAAGAGPTPLHVTGNVYLAGPYKGAPLSAVVITPALAGPFDLGAVVVRAAIYLNSETAQARAVSDPLPTILDGIPLDVRLVALRLNRSRFTINPTSCEPMAALATTTSVFNQPAALSSPFQVGDCNTLPYKPKLSTRLFGPIHRGGHPRFRAVFTAKAGEANSKRVVLALPRSEFIDQGHFRTICTRVQFASKQCPAGSVYGHVKALSPLVDYPLEGPAYLRSSIHKLPDIVLVLRGPPSQPIQIEAVGRVDSVNGGIRTTIESAPDAPVTKVIVNLQGGKKGLFQNSTNICKGTHRATLKLIGQNGKAHEARPLLTADCPKSKARGKGKGKNH